MKHISSGASEQLTTVYSACTRRLNALYLFQAGGSFRVSEIWDSQEQFEALGQRLMPILQENGIELAGPPDVLEIHNIIKR